MNNQLHPKKTYYLDGLNLSEVTSFAGIVSRKVYPLTQVSLEELVEFRLSGKPGFVLKTKGKLYYTPFPGNIHFSDQLIGTHLCGNCRNICNHCKKIDAWTVGFYTRHGVKFVPAVLRSGRIEKYDFIPYAIETFNCKIDSYLILECTNHEPH